ncbi:MAG: hypothetical protein ACE365_02605 [Gammaproteobacteria bacterium]
MNKIIQYFSNKLFWFCVFLIIPALFSTIAIQPISWDLRHYHLYDAYALFHHRLNFDIAPALLQSYYAPTLDAFNYLLEALFPPVVVNFILGALAGIAFYFAFEISLWTQSKTHNTKRYFIAVLAMAFTLTAATVWYQIGSWRGESIASIFVLAAIYLFLQGIQKRWPYYRVLFISALLIGAATGLKLTMVHCAPAFLAMQTIFFCNTNNQTFRSKLRCFFQSNFIAGIGIVFGFLLLDGYWLWRLYSTFGNPVFPMFNHFFHSPYALPLNYSNTPGYTPARDWIHTPLLPFYWLIKRHNYLIADTFRDAHVAIVFAVTALFLIYWGYRCYKNKKFMLENNLTLGLAVFYFVSFYSWAIAFGDIRFLYPTQLLSGALLVALVSRFNLRFSIKTLALLAIIIFCFFNTKHPLRRPLETHTSMLLRTQFIPGKVATPPKNSIVLLASFPISFLIPDYDPSIRFVSISNFLSAHMDTKLQQKANQLIANNPHNLYTLLYVKDFDDVSKTLAQYQLRIDQSSCQTFDKAYWHFELCRVEGKVD